MRPYLNLIQPIDRGRKMTHEEAIYTSINVFILLLAYVAIFLLLVIIVVVASWYVNPDFFETISIKVP